MNALRRLCLLPVVLAVNPWTVVQGPRFDVHTQAWEDRKRYPALAEEVGERFEAIYGDFPGVRAAVVVHHVVLPASGEFPREPDPDPDWRKGSVSWAYVQKAAFRTFSDLAGALPRGHAPRSDPAESHFRRGLALEAFRQHVAAKSSGRLPEDGFGSPLVDWLDESCAALLSSEAARASARDTMRGALLLGAWIPLEELLVMQQPGPRAPGMPPVDPDAPGPLDPGRLKRKVDDWLRKNPPAIRGEDFFPAECLSLSEFLRERYGEAFYRHVVGVHCANRGFSNVFPWLKKNAGKPKPGDPPPPETVQDLEKAWLEWARAR